MTSRITSAVVGRVDDLAVGDMRLARVGPRRIAVIRTPLGVHALDNACPHQGYGLVTGSLDGELITCQWHNWKFRASDGACLLGEEDVPCHRVDIEDGEITVTVTEPTPAEARAALWPSLRRGFDRLYVGQMARDTARLLHAGATAEDIVWAGVEAASPREEYGIGHGLAMAADCLTLSDLYEGDEKTLPVLQALAGLGEPTRNRPDTPLPHPDASIDLGKAIEAEDPDAAMASTLGQIHSGVEPATLRRQLVEAVGAHHLGYGHGAIYTQKVFELLDRVGWERAPGLLPWLTRSITYATREETLPYMRKAMRLIEAADLDAMAAAPDRRDTGWTDEGQALLSALLDSPEAAIDVAERAVLDGAGVGGLLDTVTLAVSERLLRYDPANDFDLSLDFGWLDITHGVTYARAARWAWELDPSPATARLALFTAFLAHDTGRAERWGARRVSTPELVPVAGDVAAAVLEGRADDAVAHALAGDRVEVGEALARASLADRASSWIVAAHVIKLGQAAREEAASIGSSLPLAAAARFAAAPRLERFVAANAAEALDFVRTGSPPKR